MMLPSLQLPTPHAVTCSVCCQVGAVNQRRLIAVYCGKESGFEVVHGLLNRVMDMLGVPFKGGWLG